MIYFIQSGSRIKIGRGSPFARYKAIKTASPEPVRLLLAMHVTNEIEAEARLHRHFRDHRTNREWFEINFKTAFQALSDLGLLPEVDVPTLQLPTVPPMDPEFPRWFLETRDREIWTNEDMENAKVAIEDHWHREHQQFKKSREEYKTIDEMIEATKPVTRDESVKMWAELRSIIRRPEN